MTDTTTSTTSTTSATYTSTATDRSTKLDVNSAVWTSPILTDDTFTDSETLTDTYRSSTTTDDVLSMLYYSLTTYTTTGSALTLSGASSSSIDPQRTTTAERSTYRFTTTDTSIFGRTSSISVADISSTRYYTSIRNSVMAIDSILTSQTVGFTAQSSTLSASNDGEEFDSTTGPSADIPSSVSTAQEKVSTTPSTTSSSYSLPSKSSTISGPSDSTSDFSGTANTDLVTGVIPPSVGVVPSTRAQNPATIQEIPPPNEKVSSGDTLSTGSTPATQEGDAPPSTGADTTSISPNVLVNPVPPPEVLLDVATLPDEAKPILKTPSVLPPIVPSEDLGLSIPSATLPTYLPPSDVPPGGISTKVQETATALPSSELLLPKESPPELPNINPPPEESSSRASDNSNALPFADSVSDVPFPDLPSPAVLASDVPPLGGSSLGPPELPTPEVVSSRPPGSLTDAPRPTLASPGVPPPPPDANVDSLPSEPKPGFETLNQSKPSTVLGMDESGKNLTSSPGQASLSDPETQREGQSSKVESAGLSGESLSGKTNSKEERADGTEKKGITPSNND